MMNKCHASLSQNYCSSEPMLKLPSQCDFSGLLVLSSTLSYCFSFRSPCKFSCCFLQASIEFFGSTDWKPIFEKMTSLKRFTHLVAVEILRLVYTLFESKERVYTIGLAAKSFRDTLLSASFLLAAIAGHSWLGPIDAMRLPFVIDSLKIAFIFWAVQESPPKKAIWLTISRITFA